MSREPFKAVRRILEDMFGPQRDADWDRTTSSFFMLLNHGGLDVAAASPVPAVDPDSLDEAWKAAEAALPHGDAVFGPWGMGVTVSRNPYGWVAFAGPFARLMEVGEFGDTPAAALRSLAARLSQPTPPGEPTPRPSVGEG